MWVLVWLWLALDCLGKYFKPEYADRPYRTVEVGFNGDGWYHLGVATTGGSTGSGGGEVRNGTGSYISEGVGASGGVAVMDHFVSELTGLRIRREEVDHTEFPDGFSLSHPDRMCGVAERGVGSSQLFGSPWDYHKMSYASTEDYVVHTEELLRPHIYCAGARYKKSFFVTPSVRRSTYVARDNECVRACFEFCGSRDFECDPTVLAAEDFMVYCRVPIVTVFASKLAVSVFTEGPVGTVVLPKRSFPPGTTKDQIVDVLIKVTTVSPSPDPQFNAELFRSTIPDDVNATARYQDTTETSTATASSVADIMGFGRGMNQDNRSHGGLGAGRRFGVMKMPSQDRKGHNHLGSTRPVSDCYTTPYTFWNDATSLLPAPDNGDGTTGSANVTVVGTGQAALRVRAAASHHYGMYDTNNFRYPTNTGYYADEVRVLEMPTPTEAILDVSDTVRRLLESGRLEFSLLSTSNLVASDPGFVFHLANDWLYYVPGAKATCRKQTSMRKCLYHKCNWCGHIAHANDWALASWAQHTGVRRLGNCGVPVDVCYLKKGVPTKSFVKS